MPKKKNAARAVSPTANLTPVGKSVIEGLKEAIAHARGEITLPTYRYPGGVDVKAIRAKSGLSQSGFAERYGFNLRTLQDWERGRVQTPLRNSLGVKLGDTRPYEQKVCPTIHRDNVVKVEAGPWLPTD